MIFCPQSKVDTFTEAQKQKLKLAIAKGYVMERPGGYELTTAGAQRWMLERMGINVDG